MSMYEIGKFMVYKFIVHYIVYSKLLLLTSLQVYSTSDSLQQIVGSYLQVTDQSVSYYTFALLTVCFSAITLFALLFSQSVSYYTFFTVYMYKKNMLQHYLAFISLELYYGL